MSATDIWFPFYVSDYLRDTQHLSKSEHGAYLLLLLSAWVRKGVLSDNDADFARITDCTLEEWRKIMRPRLSLFFEIKNGKWFHRRVMKEYQKTERIRKVRSAAGALGGRPGKQMVKQNESKPEANQNYSQSQSQSHKEGKEGKPLFLGNGEKASNGKLASYEIVLRHQELNRVEKALEQIRSNHSGRWTPEEKVELVRLKSRRTKLLAILDLSV